jgi:hypothetical protein
MQGKDELDLYEFPVDHVGRRTYVSVLGHVRSIPKYKTYLGSDSRNHVLPEYGGDYDGYANVGPFILPDKQPYVSPLDGSYITSRSTHIEHMRRHGVIEAGDLPPPTEQKNRDVHKPVSGRDIADAIKQLGGH